MVKKTLFILLALLANLLITVFAHGMQKQVLRPGNQRTEESTGLDTSGVSQLPSDSGKQVIFNNQKDQNAGVAANNQDKKPIKLVLKKQSAQQKTANEEGSQLFSEEDLENTVGAMAESLQGFDKGDTDEQLDLNTLVDLVSGVYNIATALSSDPTEIDKNLKLARCQEKAKNIYRDLPLTHKLLLLQHEKNKTMPSFIKQMTYTQEKMKAEKAAANKLVAEKAAAEKAAEEKRIADEKAAEKAEQEKLEKERLEKERLEKEAAEKAAADKLVAEKAAAEKAAADRVAAEKAEQEKLEREKLEKAAADKLAANKAAAEKAAAERAAEEQRIAAEKRMVGVSKVAAPKDKQFEARATKISYIEKQEEKLEEANVSQQELSKIADALEKSESITVQAKNVAQSKPKYSPTVKAFKRASKVAALEDKQLEGSTRTTKISYIEKQEEKLEEANVSQQELRKVSDPLKEYEAIKVQAKNVEQSKLERSATVKAQMQHRLQDVEKVAVSVSQEKTSVDSVQRILQDVEKEKVAVATAQGMKSVNSVQRILQDVEKEKVAVATAQGMKSVNSVQRILQDVEKEKVAVATAQGMKSVNSVQRILQDVEKEKVAVATAQGMKSVNSVQRILQDVEKEKVAVATAQGMKSVNSVQHILQDVEKATVSVPQMKSINSVQRISQAVEVEQPMSATDNKKMAKQVQKNNKNKKVYQEAQPYYIKKDINKKNNDDVVKNANVDNNTVIINPTVFEDNTTDEYDNQPDQAVVSDIDNELMIDEDDVATDDNTVHRNLARRLVHRGIGNEEGFDDEENVDNDSVEGGSSMNATGAIASKNSSTCSNIVEGPDAFSNKKQTARGVKKGAPQQENDETSAGIGSWWLLLGLAAELLRRRRYIFI